LRNRFVGLFVLIILVSSCGNSGKKEALSDEQLSAYASGFYRGWEAGCYEVFMANIGSGTLYANNTPVSYEQCLTNVGVPDYANPSLHSDMDPDWLEEKGFPSGVGGAFDFAFLGGRSLCFGDECITEDSILSNLG